MSRRFSRTHAPAFQTRLAALLACASLGSAAVASPYASAVVSYDAGANPDGGATAAGVALGSPERITSDGTSFEGAVTPFKPAWQADELVSIGSGGHLTVRFDHAVFNDAANPFGLDLLVFSNEGFVDQGWPDGFTGDTTLFRDAFGPPEAAASFEISQDGVGWVSVGSYIIDLFPTLGTNGTDFTRPVDPTRTVDSFDNMFLPDIAAAYDGSGGGFGLDIAGSGLEWFTHLRVSNNDASMAAFEIDAFADVAPVPAPASVVALIGCAAFGTRPSRRKP